MQNEASPVINPPLRIQLKAQGVTPGEEVKTNYKRASKYEHVEWAVLAYSPCAVCGGGPSLEYSLDHLRKFQGDIFAINDTAKYLSDHGIPHWLYAIDGTKTPFRVGDLTKGAVFATRVHRRQFTQMKQMGRHIRVFDMAEEDNKKGIEGGPTAVCRTPHLMLRMGYAGVYYFGLDGSFTNVTHITGKSQAAYDNMIVVRAGGKEYITNAGFMLQHEYMSHVLHKYPKFLHNASGGLFKAILENPDTWEVVAIAEDLKDKYEKGGCHVWNREFQFGGQQCQQQAI
jgi:hypothetical protein